MDSSRMKPIEQIMFCIQNQQSFVLQGGAGSGKTETLKQSLEFISSKYIQKKVACITHTNLAVAEISSRVGNGYTISTIHSFLNSIIKDYKKNIHQVIYELFKLSRVERLSAADFSDNDKDLKKAEHDNYKYIYEKYAKSLFILQKGSVEKVIGKRDYDKNPNEYNSNLNSKIDNLNNLIKTLVEEKDSNKIVYNETKFNSLANLTYGHDGLIDIAALLFERYPKITRILQDKFDYIFIDEFQDTNPKIIDIFLDVVIKGCKVTVGLFGDSMQSIYEDGVGNVDKYVNDKKIFAIPKRDNYRCSEQVISYLNSHRVPLDGLDQELAFKSNQGKLESAVDRQGFVKLFYAIYSTGKPNALSSSEDKETYISTLMKLIDFVELENNNFKKLMLTNKAISKKLAFEKLFTIFSDRYSEVNNEIEACLESLQLLELAKLIIAYRNHDFNFVIKELKKSGFKITSISDKKEIKEQLEALSSESLSAIDAISFAKNKKIIKGSEGYAWYIKKRDSFLLDLQKDLEFQSFKIKYLDQGNTFTKFESNNSDFFGGDDYTGREARYNNLVSLFKKERFYQQLFSKQLPFFQIINFLHYLNEESDYITMHKTKGSGIDNVLVVLEDFFWGKYQFKMLYEQGCENLTMKVKMQKLFYVACSRAKNNLICVSLLNGDEEQDFLNHLAKNVFVQKLDIQ